MEITHVLLIEDDVSFAYLVEQMLGSNYLVERVATLGEGLGVIEGGGIDVVLLDLTLPDTVDARETLRQFFEIHTEVAVLILSNHSDPDLMLNALAVGAQGYLIKGQINLDWLRSAVFQAVLARQYQRQHKAKLAQIFEDLYQVWEEESIRLYQMAETFEDVEEGGKIHQMAETISSRLARLAGVIATDIRTG